MVSYASDTTLQPPQRVLLTQTEKSQDSQDDNDETNDPDNAVHDLIPLRIYTSAKRLR